MSHHNPDHSALLFDTSRITPDWPARFLAMLTSDPDCESNCVSCVLARYGTDPLARDGFSRLGYGLLEAGQPAKARAYFEKDIAANRCSWWQHLRYAECLAALGELPAAEAIVTAVYAREPDACNGYAAIAWRLRDSGRLESPHQYASRDIASQRASPGFLLNIAVLAGIEGTREDSLKHVADAYKMSASLTDGYTRLASEHMRKTCPDRARQLILKDLSLGRLSQASARWSIRWASENTDWQAARDAVDSPACHTPLAAEFLADLMLHFTKTGQPDFAEQAFSSFSRLAPSWNEVAQEVERLASLGKQDAAQTLVEIAYSRDTTATNGYAMLALAARASLPPRKVCQLIGQDIALNRIAANPALWHAAAYSLKCGRIGDANLIIGKLGTCPTTTPESQASAPVCRAPPLVTDPVHSLSMLGKWSADGNSTTHLPATIRKSARALSRHIGALTSMIQEAEDITALPVRQQWNTLVEAYWSDAREIPVLSSRLHLASVADALVQFREIVLSQCYRFSSDTQRPFIIDGGANVGMSLAYFKWLYPDARILAFEPNPTLFDICMGNIQRNHWQDVTLLPFALADTDNPHTLIHSREMPMASTISDSIPAAFSSAQAESITIPCRRLSTFLNEHADYLKLDIEGAEGAVLSEAAPLLQNVRRGYIEYHHNEANASNALSRILAVLTTAGFDFRITQPPSEWVEGIPSPPPVTRWSASIHFVRTTPSQVPAAPHPQGTAL